MDEPSKKVIDGFTYELQPLPGWVGFEVFGNLVKVLGPAFGSTMKLVMMNRQQGTAAKAVVGAGALVELAGALQGTDMKEVVAIGRTLLTGCIIGDAAGPDLFNGKKLAKLADIFDQHFKGKTMEVIQVIFWAIQVNYAGFFDGLASANLGALAKPSMSQSPSETAGAASGSSTGAGQPSPS